MSVFSKKIKKATFKPLLIIKILRNERFLKKKNQKTTFKPLLLIKILRNDRK
jgi:hypothetical protein